MYRTLSDLRLLRLAHYLEDAFEGYEQDLRNDLLSVPVRARLAVLFQEGPAHRRLREALASLEAQAGRIEAGESQESVLQAILECEKAAHDFYLNNLDRLSEPALVDVFRALADEERTHILAVQDAIRILKEQPRGVAAYERP